MLASALRDRNGSFGAEIRGYDGTHSQRDFVDKGRGTVPRLNLLPNDRLDPSLVFAPALDKRLDGSIEAVGQFTAGHGRYQSPGTKAYVTECDRGYLKGQT